MFAEDRYWRHPSGQRFTRRAVLLRSAAVLGGVAVTLKKNAAWFRPGLPYIDGVRAAIVQDPATQLAQFTAGNLDVAHPQSNDLATFQQSNPKAGVAATSSAIATSIFGHMNEPSSPWRDLRVRQAVSMAIDRTGLKKAVLNNHAAENAFLPATAGKWMLPVDKFGDAAQYYQYHPAEVKKLLQATAGGPQLTRLLYPTQAYGPSFDATSTTVASMLNAAGFKIQLVPLDYNKDFIGGGNGALSGNYPADALLMAGNTFLSSAEETLYGQFQTGSTKNKSQVSDATVDQMLNKMRGTPDDAARLQLCYDIQKYLAALTYFVPLPSEEAYTVLQPWVHNWYAGGGDGRAFIELWIKR